MTTDVTQELLAIEDQIVAQAVPFSQPFLLHMLGIPGAGKTTFLNILLQNWPSNLKTKPTLLGFDQVMQALPSYQLNPDKPAAFAALELPARATGYSILERLLDKKTSILFDNGGSAPSHPDLLLRARDVHGFQIIFVSIVTKTDDARARVDARAVTAGQHTPLHYLEERAQKLQQLMGVYRTLTPHFFEIENTGDDINAFKRDCVRTARLAINVIV